METRRKPSYHLISCYYCNAMLPAYSLICSSCGKRVEQKKNGEEEIYTKPSSDEASRAPFQIEGAQSSPTVPASLMLRTGVLAPVRSNLLWPTIIIFSAVAAGLVYVVLTDTIVRPVVVFWFLSLCPGMIVVRYLRLKEPVIEWTLALALSIIIDATVAAIQVYAGKWSPTGTLSILIAFSLIGATVQLTKMESAISNKVYPIIKALKGLIK